MICMLRIKYCMNIYMKSAFNCHEFDLENQIVATNVNFVKPIQLFRQTYGLTFNL